MSSFDLSRSERRMMKSIHDDVMECNNIKRLREVKREYSIYDHPYPNYFLGSAFETYGDREEALSLYISAFEPYTTFPNEFWDSQHSDSIGSAISRTITNFDVSSIDKDVYRSLHVLSFSYLSKSISILRDIEGAKMFDSLFNRGKILSVNKDVVTFITQKYLGYGYLNQVMAFSDFYLSHLEYLRDGKKQRAEKAFRNAETAKSWLEDIEVNGKPAEEYINEDLAKVGIRRNKKMFENMKDDVLENKYQLENKSFREEILSSVST